MPGAAYATAVKVTRVAATATVPARQHPPRRQGQPPRRHTCRAATQLGTRT